MFKLIKNIVLTAVTVVVLTACGAGGSGPNLKPISDKNKSKGLALYAQKNYFEATKWLTAAWQKNANDPEIYVALVDAYGQLGEITQVWQLLNQSDIETAEIKVIEAELAINELRCKDSLRSINAVNDYMAMNQSWQQRYWQSKSHCLTVEKKHLAAVVALVKMEPYSTDQLEIQSLHNQIVNNLIKVPENELILAIGDPSYDLTTQGWIEAAYVNFGADGMSGDGWITQWPNHPAAQFFLDFNRVNSQQQVAVLLPLSGRFSAVAKAVQKGMLAASAADADNQNNLMFYDTGSQGESVSEAWYAAQNNQADLIIGPLDKQSIEAVEMMPESTIPVVLLNQSASNYYQFTLSPEGEAQQVAERMIADGHKSVIIMAANDKWGERMTQAFAQRFVDLGGQLLTNTYFEPAQNDYSVQLRKTLGLIESQLRAQNLQGFLKLNLSADEVIRSDVDAIFLAAQADFARLMVPQLKFHRAAGLPVYSTSDVFDGINNVRHNRDLQGLKFAISPIELQSSQFKEVLPFEFNRINADKRLFSLGYDAYQLVNRLSWMSRVNTGVIDGLTGKVTLDIDGQFSRGLSWAQYDNGSIITLPR